MKKYIITPIKYEMLNTAMNIFNEIIMNIDPDTCNEEDMEELSTVILSLLAIELFMMNTLKVM